MGCVLSLMIGLAGAVNAQVTTGTISGRISDSQGNVVPGATVQVINADTNVVRATETNAAGEYVFPFLPPGPYRLVIRKTGFQEIIKSGLTLQVQQTIAQNFALTVGSVSQSVQVTGESPVMQTESAAVGQVIDNQTVNTLPLNGRDYTQLVTLAAGAVQNSNARVSNGFSLNGGQTFQAEILLNGLENINRFLGTGSTSTIDAITPSIDAIQEFSVQTGDYGAEYGHSAGGVVSVVIKSGTNQFHGDVFDYLRNDKLDANDYFAKRSGLVRPPLRRNQFGGTLGGPILRNHSFFFVSYQGTRQASSTSGQVTVPTLPLYTAIQAGQAVDFGSTNIYNPFNVVGKDRQQFANNTIPANLFDPVGLKIAQLYPKPNLTTATNNYGYSQTTTTNLDEIDSRFDEQLGSRDNTFVTYSRGTGTLADNPICPPPGNCGSGAGYPLEQPLRAWSIGIGDTHIVSASMVNDVRIGYSHNYTDPDSMATQPLFQQFGLKGIPALPGLNGLPTFTVSSYTGLGDRGSSPNPKLVQITQGTDTFSWIHKKHSIKFGAQVIVTHNYGDTYATNRGSFSFNGQFTSQVPGTGSGSALADLLLGQTDTAAITSVEEGKMRDHYYGYYIQDTWSATPALTLNMGLRYDLQTPPWERDNDMSNFDVIPGSPEIGTFVLAKPGSYLNRTFNNLDKHNFAPRLGIAYQLNSKTVIRAGAGIFYGGLGFQSSATDGFANLPFAVSVSLPSATSAATSDLVLANGFPAGIVNPANNTAYPSTISYLPDFPMPAVAQWNLTVQRSLSGNSALTVAYVGSSSYDMMSDNNLNAPPPGPGSLNPRRPFQASGANTTAATFGHASYDALQVTYNWRFHRGISVLSDYTYSRAIDNIVNQENNGTSVTTSPQNPNDVNAERAVSILDVPHHLSTSVIYELPFGNPGGLLSRSALARKVVGGWQVGGILNLQHGYPLTPTVSPDPANNGTPARPNRLCNGNLPRGSGTTAKWYNPACFAPAAAYTFGDSGRDVIYSPGIANLDFLVDRRFDMKEARSLEFRGEFFNFTNSAHFGDPDITTTDPQAGSITSDSSPNREIEVALRFRF